MKSFKGHQMQMLELFVLLAFFLCLGWGTWKYVLTPTEQEVTKVKTEEASDHAELEHAKEDNSRRAERKGYPGNTGLAVGIFTFIGCWIFAIVRYGFLLGVGLGWLPSLIIGLIAAWIWPLVFTVILVAGIAFVLFVLYLLYELMPRGPPI